MDTIKFVEQCLNEAHERLVKSFQGLSQEELVWRPAPQANCIAEIMWHLARNEDRMVRSRIGLGPEIWQSQEWYNRFGYPREQSRDSDYQLIRVLGFPPPQLEDLLAYMEAVHQDTLDKLHSFSPADLDRVPDSAHPERPIAFSFRHLITHNNHHHGQVDYIRGLVQPGWDLPSGTGHIQP